MRSMMATAAVALLVLVAVATATVVGPNSAAAGQQGNLKRVVFAHRHGARTPTSNTDGACDQLGCGTLTEQGALMLKSLGETFRGRYGSILPDTYHSRAVKSVADGSDRVLQSASAFLTGLYAYNASYQVYPAIESDEQQLMDPLSNPTYMLHMIGVVEGAIVNVSDKILANIVNRSDIVAVGKEMKLDSLECDVVPQLCLAKEIDFLEAMKAEGKLAQFPIGQQLLPKLTEARRVFYGQLYGGYDIDHNTTFLEDAGWPGSALFSAMVDSAAGGPALMEYSGHDTSLIPLYGAMGNHTWAYPDFATAVIFEVYEGAPSAASSVSDGRSEFVKVVVGTCDQYPGTHPFTIAPYVATCMDAQGQTYTTDQGCPLADLQRFAATRTGTYASKDPLGCYAWPKDLADTWCTGDAAADPKLPCGKYRKACPFTACGAGKYMTADLACHATI